MNTKPFNRSRRRGFTIVELMILIPFISTINVLTIPRMNCVKGKANEASAISSLRTVVSSQAMFYQGDIDGKNGNDYAQSLAILAKHKMIDAQLGSGKKDGYRFVLTSSIPSAVWKCIATPDPKNNCSRNLFVNESGVIRWSTSGEASSSSDAIELSSGPLDWNPHGIVFDGSDLSFVLETLHGAIDNMTNDGIEDTLAEVTTFLSQEESIQSLLQGADSNGDERLTLDEIQELDLAEALGRIQDSLPLDLADAEVTGSVSDLQDLFEETLEEGISQSGIEAAISALEENLSDLEEREIRDEFDEIFSVDPLLNWREMEVLQLPADSSVIEAAAEAIAQAINGN